MILRGKFHQMNLRAIGVLATVIGLLCLTAFQNCAPQESGDPFSKAYAPPKPQVITPPVVGDPPGPQISITDAAAEPGFSLEFDITLSEPADVDIDIALETVNGTALANRDFQPFNNSIKILKGQVSKTIFIPSMMGSTTINRQFQLKIVSISSGILNQSLALGSILAPRTIGTPLIPIGLRMGVTHVCGLSVEGEVKCWGKNDKGQLGPSNLAQSTAPVLVPNLISVEGLAAGWDHNCVVASVMVTVNNQPAEEKGRVKCWGSNNYGQLGTDSAATFVKAPAYVPGLTRIRQVYAGAYHSCSLDMDGNVKCWGLNNFGQLGNNSVVNSKIPVAVSGLTKIKNLSLGTYHSCAITNDNLVRCWGHSAYGQMGQAITAPQKIPITVPNLSGVKVIASGGLHSCAVVADNTVKCWGANVAGYEHGQVGGANLKGVLIPVAVAGLTGIKALSLGNRHSCAVTTSNLVKCWGRHLFASNGVFAVKDTNVPVDIGGSNGTLQIDAGINETCLMNNQGIGKCWGTGGAHFAFSKKALLTPILAF